jgi:hypothetical protein
MVEPRFVVVEVDMEKIKKVIKDIHNLLAECSMPEALTVLQCLVADGYYQAFEMILPDVYLEIFRLGTKDLIDKSRKFDA